MSPGSDKSNRRPAPNGGSSPAEPSLSASATEKRRLAALQQYLPAHPSLEDDLDRLADLARLALEAPIGLVTTVGKRQQRHHGMAGTDIAEIAREHSFCRHAIAGRGTTVVHDLAADDRFADNPFVAGPPHLRFYAGAPITTPDGEPLGTVCALGPDPVFPSDTQIRQLEQLAEMAMSILSQKRDAGAGIDILSRTIIDSLPGIFYVINPDGRLRTWNERFEAASGLSGEELHDRPAVDFFEGDDRRRIESAIATVFESGSATVEAHFQHSDGEAIPMLFTGVRARLNGRVRLVGMGIDKSAQKAEERRRRVLAEAVHQASEAVLITEGGPLEEPGPRIAYANPAFAAMTGYDRDEVEGKTPRILQGPDTDFDILYHLRRALVEGESVEQETINYRKDGTPYFVRWNISPVRGEDGDVEHWVSVQQDVTEQRRRQQALRESERRFRQLTESIDEVFWLRTADEILYTSQSFEEMWGRPVARLEEDVEAYHDWIHPDDRASVRAKCEALFEEGRPVDTEYRIVRPDGSVRWLDVEFRPVASEGEEPRFAGVFRDITDRKKAEKAVAQERDRLATLLQTLPTPAVYGIPDEDEFRIVRVNSAFREVFGIDEAADLRGENLHDIIVPDEERETAVELNRRLLDEGTLQSTGPRRTADGIRYFRTDARVRTQEDGPDEAYVIYVDMTQRKEYERKLREAKEEAEEAAELKSSMLANMSHEVRTPLTSIVGFAEILKQRLTDREREFADMIHQSGQQLRATIDSVLQLSELESGSYDPERERINLTSLAGEIRSMLQPQAQTAGLTMSIESGSGSVEAWADREAVRRVVINVADNAVKFTEADGRVTLRVFERSDEAGIEIEDTGIGIGDEEMESVFEAFRQESTGLSRDFEGTGLGLTIARRLTEAQGGRLKIESEKGEGTRVTVLLPKDPNRPTSPSG